MKIVGHSSGITRKSSTFGYAPKNRRKTHHETGAKDFIAIDGEGITLDNGEHRYVLLGIGDKQIEDENGLEWTTILDFLYDYFCERYTPNKPNYAYVGFYLAYDFNRWLCTMPAERVERLITREGMAVRKSKSPRLHGQTLPVDMPYGWQINMVGTKMFKFRRRSCNCDLFYCKCPGKGPWMYICDAGPFFQTSLLKAIDPKGWNAPIVSSEEYELIKRGKAKRAYATCIDDEMRYYNRLENDILVRLMRVLDKGFREMGIVLAPNQWFGPGQAAQKWMKNNKISNTKEIQAACPQWFLEAARMSYFGGWIEIMMHGIIPGVTHAYDINSAYPYIISSLPCLLHGKYEWGDGEPNASRKYTLVYASVSSIENGKRPPTIGTMLHRNHDATIQRPLHTEGWFWIHELNAAKRAGLIKECRIFNWMSYDPCNCLPPLRDVQFLYDLRIKVGKDTPLGKGCRLAYNSMYGKFAQSIGDPIFANPIWASLITAGCRTMILEAIATHPKGMDDVCMVATDAVFFCSPHPKLPISNKLGEWDYTPRNNLTLFKPGVYWDDNTRRDINEDRTPIFKARGIAAADFASTIPAIDRRFQQWEIDGPELSFDSGVVKGWPIVIFETGFAMTSCLQAIRRGDWSQAGEVKTDQDLHQNSNPSGKRIGAFLAYLDDGRIVWRSIPRSDNEHNSKPYLKRFGMEDPWSDESLEMYGITPEGTIRDVIAEWLGTDGTGFI